MCNNESELNATPFTFDVTTLIEDSIKPKRNDDGVIMIEAHDAEGRDWYYNG